MDYINNVLTNKLDECYFNHKNLSKKLALKIDESNNYKKFEDKVNRKETENNLEENNKQDFSFDNSNSLESIMIDIVKNSSKYNTISRMISIRDRIYEVSIKGR